jgi:signal transduction histidine kinase
MTSDLDDERARLLARERDAREEAEGALRRLNLLQQVTADLQLASTVDEVATILVTQGAAALGARTSTVSRIDESTSDVVVIQSVGYPPELVHPGLRLPLSARSPVTDAGRTGEPVWIESRTVLADRYPHLVNVPAMTISQAWATLPLWANGRLAGVLTISYDTPQRFDAKEQALLSTLAHQCAQAMERVRLGEAERAARKRLAVLADATAAFSTVSLDRTTLLDTIVRRVSEEIGDGAIVYSASDDGAWIVPEAIHHPDPESLAFSKLLFDLSPIRPSENMSGNVILTGEPIILPSVNSQDLKTRMKPEHWPYFDKYGVHALAVVPLRGRDQRIGALAVWRNRANQPYVADDLTLLQDLADRAALALENARLYAQAQEAIRLRDEFLSIAAHEIRTPLTGLRGSAQLIARLLDTNGTIEPGRLRARLATVDQQSAKLAHLIDQLLDISRLDAGRLSLELARTEITSLVSEVVASAQTRTAQHAIAVNAVGPVYAVVDALRLEQAIANLIENAIKYSPAGGAIEVTINCPSADEVAIAVTDHGIGIPVEHRARIFDRFYQAHNGHNLGGLGLGLFISRQIVELHRGSLRAEFPTSGGTRFVICLPVAVDLPSSEMTRAGAS